VRLALEAENIEARPVWKPMHLQPVFAGAEIHGGKISERLFENGLCLPSGAGLSSEERDRVITAVKRAFNR
jgi:dTDP-4-amino-4,6-dideoxygalactose transaminase